jgi:hypothetical protein
MNPIEKPVKTIAYRGVEMQVVERPDVIWVGCVDYAPDNSGESDIAATLKRYREELIDIQKRAEINPDWSAALSINYTCPDRPCGIMFAQETYSAEQDGRYDLFTQPGGLWLKLKNDRRAAALLGKESAAPFEYFAEPRIMQNAALENGYMQNPDVHIQVEYHCHAEYGTPPHTNYAYIPVIRAK